MPMRNLPVTKTLSLIAASLLASCATWQGSQQTLPLGPSVGDQALSPFYRWPGPMPSQPGVMLRTEPMPAQAEIPAASAADRILYTSTDARWRSGIVPVSGTLYLPRGQAPQGGWPLVAWAHGTLGVADRCAPSWALHRPRDATYINAWLENGFAVVATDFQGLGGPGPHPYLIWEAEGRSVLDSVRAALAAHGRTVANDVIITGQSQGSGSALGASRIATAYAPDMRLRATIATGVVSSFPAGPYQPAPVTSGRGSPAHFQILRMLGGAIPDGGPTVDSLISEKGKPLLQAAREGCNEEMRQVAQKDGVDATNAFDQDNGKVMALMTEGPDMSLVRMPAPLFLGTGLADRTIPPRRQYAAATALCAAGNPLLWKAYPGITHNGIVNAAFRDELAFVRNVLAGTPNASNCQQLVEPGMPGAALAGVPFNE
jgi:hypothetical protein